MPTLRLVSIRCNKQEDFWGDDTVYIFVNGRKVWGPRDIDTNQHLVINKDVSFKRSAEIELFDQDGGYDGGGSDDDLLGRAILRASDLGEHALTTEFTTTSHGYTIRCEVLANPMKSAHEVSAQG